jgi:hypothetical protein
MGRKGDQKSLFFFAELADLPTLHHKYAYHSARVDQRHPAEAVETLLFGLGYIVKGRVRFGVRQVDRVSTGRYQPYKALAGGNPDPANRSVRQSVGGKQQHFPAGIGQVETAYIHSHAGTDRFHDQVYLIDRLLCQGHRLHDAG